MNKFIVVASFTCHDVCEDEIFNSQWLVGSFDDIDDCIEAAKKDLVDVAKDHYECVLEGEDFDSEEEYYDAMAENVENYLSEQCPTAIGAILIDLDNGRKSVEILSNDFVDDNYTDQRQVVSYFIHKII
jgi:hypothetical protein